MKKILAAAFGLVSLFSTQAALADNVTTYDVSAYLWWHQTQTDGAPTSLTGRFTYDYTTNLFTQASVSVGPYQFSMNGLEAPYTTQVVWNSVGIDQTTTCALAAGQTCSNGLQAGNFVELGILPLEVGPTASDSFTAYGTVPFQFEALLGTNGPTPDGQPVFAEYIGHGQAAAVPEASNYLMMLAGLGLVGCAVRRKQSTK